MIIRKRVLTIVTILLKEDEAGIIEEAEEDKKREG